MKRIQFTQDINAPAEKVFRTMLGLENIKTYEHWTAAFNPTSTYEGSWDKGAKIYFVGTGEDGKRGGMVTEIADYIPNRFVSIRHYGMLEGDTEITEGAEVEQWAGGLENYAFAEKDGVTTLTIELDVTEDHIDYFNTTWPEALNKLRALAEN